MFPTPPPDDYGGGNEKTRAAEMILQGGGSDMRRRQSLGSGTGSRPDGRHPSPTSTFSRKARLPGSDYVDDVTVIHKGGGVGAEGRGIF